ncbi:S9 family peptidase [Novosphingobium sp. Rr 2-17]|uniref:S9 family peptidase n=1 Tax=Novosphingobium sp. Rr 2-17 TaxID=555793 RepID=UPI001ED8EFE0|nr:S9 family peptidase [Novosphingobium sp. Rr 2-17]
MEKLLPLRPPGAQWAPPILVSDQLAPTKDGQGWQRPGGSHLWVFKFAPEAKARQITQGDYSEGSFAWTSDSRALLFSSQRSPEADFTPSESDLYQVDLSSGAVQELTHRQGLETSPVQSPDGKYVAYVGSITRGKSVEDDHLFLLELSTGKIRELAAKLDRSMQEPTWSTDSRWIYFHYNDHGDTRIARVDLSDNIQKIAVGLGGDNGDRPYMDGSFSLANDGTVAFPSASADRPLEAAVSRKGKTQVVSHLNDALLSQRCVAQVDRISVASSVDGRSIEAWLMKPPISKTPGRLPLILEIHGGPYSGYGPIWASQLQLYAAAGYAVLYTNPRGSDGEGQAFKDTVDRDFPGRSAEDLTSAVDAAIALGEIDPDRLYVTGGSGGGLLTAWLVGTTDRFAAAAAVKPVIDWVSETLTTDLSGMMLDTWFRQPPWLDHASYWNRSPISLVGRVRTPTMLIVGQEDQRTPPGQAIEFYKALKYRGVPARLAIVPNEGHESIVSRPSQLIATSQLIINWFDKYPKRGPIQR